MKLKRIAIFMAMVATMLCAFGFIAHAEDVSDPVAKVGSTEYDKIEEAIAAWTKGTTLTLLDDVTFDGPIKIKTGDNQTLDLSEYTMTVVNGANAIEIIASLSDNAERTAITIKSKDNAGTLDAGKKSVVYYDYSKGTTTGNDRPIIKVEGGRFIGPTSGVGTSAGFYAKGTAARKCATFDISGGIFDCAVLGTGKNKMLISGGTFNYSVSSQGDQTCYRLISGGRFKTFGFMTADSNNTKFWIGTSMGNSNVGVYIDDEGYLVVGGPVITEAGDRFDASIDYGKWSSYLKYSSAANGLYCTNVEVALGKATSIGIHDTYANDVNVTKDITFDLTDENAEITGEIKVDTNKTFTILFNKDDEPVVNIKTSDDTCIFVVTDSEQDGVITRKYKSVVPEASVNGEKFATLEAAVEEAGEDEAVVLLADNDADIITTKNTAIDMSRGAEYTGDVTLGAPDHLFTITFDSDNPYEGTVTPYTGYAIKYVDTYGAIVTRTYSNAPAVAKIGDVLYASLEDALANVTDGDTITLLDDIELDNTISMNEEITFTLDGRGKKISASSVFASTNSAIMLGNSGNNKSHIETRNYTIKNIIFDGWTTSHVIRVQGAKATIDGCTFKNTFSTDTQNKENLAIVSFSSAEPTVKNCTFENNNCLKCIDLGSWGVDQNVLIDGCTFKNNVCGVTAVIYLHSGSENGTFTNCIFEGNTVNADGNAAVLYLGFNENVTVTGCLFKDNVVNGTTKRVGALQVGVKNEISGNAFINNTATINGGEAALRQIAEAGYYHAGDLSSNYFGPNAPVWGTDIAVEYGYFEPVVDDYYTEYSLDADGNVVLSGLKYIVKDIKLDFVDVTENGTEGKKIYNINLIAPGKIINRLNSVDLSFIHTMIDGDTDFEIIASNPEVIIYPVENSKTRYEFHYNGKTDVESDTAETITIGQVKFEGYGEFSFAVNASATTNAAHATKNEDNIVDTFVPGGNEELNYGTFDVSDSDITGIEIQIPKRTLTINVAFPNIIKEDALASQAMTVTIKSSLYDETIDLTEFALVDGVYTITRNLDYNTTYMVTVEGAGYRTARYSVVMSQDKGVTKTLNFWNNVKSAHNAMEIEEGVSGDTTKNFLAGDIVKDNTINIWDLNAVVSFFGTASTENEAKYVRYDLNRDGKIDSKDVAYVLVSWGE